MLQALESRQMLSGQTITVNSAADDNAAATPTHMTLRNAIRQANLDAGADTINFATSLRGKTIVLTQGELDIRTSMTITGLGAGALTVSGDSKFRVFHITSVLPTVTITDLTIANGTASNNVGGGVFTYCRLTLRNDVFIGNSADSGGAVANGSNSLLTIVNTTFSGNVAVRRGGAIYNVGTVSSTNNSYSGNTAKLCAGGAISNSV